jgi:hypothetical protein
MTVKLNEKEASDFGWEATSYKRQATSPHSINFFNREGRREAQRIAKRKFKSQKSKVKSQNRTPYLKRKTNNSSIVKLVQRLVLRFL